MDASTCWGPKKWRSIIAATMRRTPVLSNLGRIFKKDVPEDMHSPNNETCFTKEQEELLATHLKNAAEISHGLTEKEARKLAFQCAKNFPECPEDWQNDKMASKQWLGYFMDRYKHVSIRNPLSTFIVRAAYASKASVNTFIECLTYPYVKLKAYNATCTSTNISYRYDDNSYNSDAEILYSERKRKVMRTAVTGGQDVTNNQDLCIICREHYVVSKEEWLQCGRCKKWAHKSCGCETNNKFFCNNCLFEMMFTFNQK